MPYLKPFLKVNVHGRFGSSTGVEEWSTGFHVSITSGTPDATAFLETISVPISTFWSSGVVGGSVNYLTELTAAVIGTDGKYLGGAAQATKRRTYTTPVASAGTVVAPWPTSCVLSLRVQSLGRGPTSHGRMYWPMPAMAVTPATGRWPAATTDAIAAAAKTMFQAINAAAVTSFGTGARIVNVSKVGGGGEAGVDMVLVGNRPDHQERRENAAAEIYSVQTF